MQDLRSIVLANFDVRSGHNGNEFACICPWHNGGSPNLYINVNSGMYICFSCGIKGNRKGGNEES